MEIWRRRQSSFERLGAGGNFCRLVPGHCVSGAMEFFAVPVERLGGQSVFCASRTLAVFHASGRLDEHLLDEVPRSGDHLLPYVRLPLRLCLDTAEPVARELSFAA